MQGNSITMLGLTGTVNGFSNLYSRLCEFCPLSQLLSGVDVWVMCPFKSLLQLLQLLSCKGGATASLLPLQGQVRL